MIFCRLFRGGEVSLPRIRSVIDGMKRRDFITLLGGAAASWPLAARGQQPGRMRRVGVLESLAPDDPQSQSRMRAFGQSLQQLGWTDGRNVQIDIRWGAGDGERLRRHAAELVGLAPDVIVASTVSSMVPLQQATRTVPIVFVQVTDAVGAGFVESLSRPGGNATGFSISEYGFSAKWLELLKQIAPRVTRVGILRDPSNPSGIGLLAAIQGVAPALGVELNPLGVRDAGEIERAIAAFAQRPNGGLILVPTALTVINRQLIIDLAARHQLPAVYPYRYFVTAGGLICYGADEIEQYRGAAGYVDRILKGATPADLPVQSPTKYETVLNLKTAKALGLQVPDVVRLRADEVIE
jgi:putative ABC transport system substrate-binding protein